MRKIVQLSDLHFNRTDPEVVSGLIAMVNELRPDVIAVSGDLTQRGTPTEFWAAKQFLDQLPYPQVIVPGNHDISFYNPWRRFVRPLVRFRNIINVNAEPEYIDDEIAVIGLNTARSLVFKGGRVSRAQIQRIQDKVAGLDPKIFKMVVSHHPLDRIRTARNGFRGYSETALESLINSGVQLFMSGHMHFSSSAVREAREAGKTAYMVRAGTSTSIRYRNEPNSFNVITIEGPEVSVESYHWQPETQKFIKL